MDDLLDTVKAFLLEDNWPYTQLEGRTVFQLEVDTEQGHWNCFAQTKEEQNQFLFYSVSPTNGPQDKRLALAEFFTRVNFGLIVGNFEMDWEDGEIRYKTGLDVENDRLSVALVRNLAYANVRAMGRYLPGILAIIQENATPDAAFAQIMG